MITFELGNVHQQQLILVKKVRLIDNIDEQYKEQVKLLNQQVCFNQELFFSTSLLLISLRELCAFITRVSGKY